MKVSEIKDIKKLFKKSAKKKRRALIHPLRDWSLGLAVAVTLFLGGVTVIAFDFYFQLVSPVVPEAGDKPLVYKQEDVVRYATEYNEKAKMFNERRAAEVYVPIMEEAATSSPSETLAEDDVDG